MPNYRRNRVWGGTYFFTVNLLDCRSHLLVTHVALLRQVVRDTLTRQPFHINAWVVLPNHMHCVWTLPDGDDDFPARWRTIKAAFSKGIPGGEARSVVMALRGDRGVWQPRYWEHTIRDDRDYAAHLDYTHFNPVHHGLADHPGEWPHSSFRRCVARGVYPAEWAGDDDGLTETGERL